MARKPDPAPVPQSRLGRLARIGFSVAEFAAAGALDGLRGLGRSNVGSTDNPMFSVRNAQRLAGRLAKLRGAAMKLGQIVSLQGADVLPPEFAQALAVLRSGAAPMPVSQLRRVLGREYGRGWESRFAHFDFEPIAAASIGQVHRARARERPLDLALRRGLLRAPPPETMFLHRKLAGSFLLLARIGARIDARALVLPFLPHATRSRRTVPRFVYPSR